MSYSSIYSISINYLSYYIVSISIPSLILSIIHYSLSSYPLILIIHSYSYYSIHILLIIIYILLSIIHVSYSHIHSILILIYILLIHHLIYSSYSQSIPYHHVLNPLSIPLIIHSFLLIHYSHHLISSYSYLHFLSISLSILISKLYSYYLFIRIYTKS